jgi:hypothetical protein
MRQAYARERPHKRDKYLSLFELDRREMCWRWEEIRDGVRIWKEVSAPTRQLGC